MQSTENSTGISENVLSRELTEMGFTNEYIERQKERNFPELSDQDRGFAIEYIQNGYSHTDAAEKVGRARSAGKKLLANPLVAAYIKFLQEGMWQESLITHHFVEMKYFELLDMAMGEEEINLVDKDGHQFQAKITDISNAVKIVDKMSLMNGHSQKPEDKGKGNISIRIDNNAWLGEPPEGQSIGITIDQNALETDDASS